MANRVVDWYMTYQFMKRLVMPFTSWPAFKAGVIDAQGNVIVHKTQRTPAQSSTWDVFDVVVANLKKLLAKIPGGSSKIASMAAAAWLMIEYQERKFDPENVELIEQSFIEYYNTLVEEGEGAAPTNAAGNGNVAGIGVGPQGEPGGKAAVLKKMIKRKKLDLDSTTTS